MCGICGILKLDKVTVHQNELQVMADKMVMRGPDSDGYYINQNIGLGFRRLAIIDLLSGDQPLTNEDRSIWLVMNGEIYNYIELRKELQLKGHTFSTKSDAEVIIHLYEEYGNECVLHLNGMFAFALHDQSSNKLLLGARPVRDKTTLLQNLASNALFCLRRKGWSHMNQPPRVKGLVSSIFIIWIYCTGVYL